MKKYLRANSRDQNYQKLRPKGKGRKLAWQGVWHENTKGAAQLRAFSSTGAFWQGEHPDLHIEAMYVGRGEDENISSKEV